MIPMRNFKILERRFRWGPSNDASASQPVSQARPTGVAVGPSVKQQLPMAAMLLWAPR